MWKLVISLHISTKIAPTKNVYNLETISPTVN